MDALLSDICISMSAAPTYLPAHYFKTEDSHGNTKEFNLIDGGVAANNPALVAIGEVSKQIFKQDSDFFPIKPMDYGRFLVISLGTGSSKFEEKYDAQKAKSWGMLDWLLSSGSTPLVDIFTRAIDVATKDNMEKLVNVGVLLLKKPVSRANLETGQMVPTCSETEETNEEALKRFAKLLSDEKKIRQARSPK
uniref:PNPLA domain-containing protein n=1 Tax=Hordeum vulgare subsp. vulgare TaxID=112509 RepID=A0A8I6WKC2_HORVV